MAQETAAARIAIEKTAEAVVARLQVKLLEDEDLKTLARLVDDAAAGGSGVSVVVLDLTKVVILPSLALGTLVQINNKCKAREQKMKLAGVQQQVRQVFAVTRLDRIFQFADTVDAAISQH